MWSCPSHKGPCGAVVSGSQIPGHGGAQLVKTCEIWGCPKCLEDTNTSTGVAVGCSGSAPAVNTGSWGECGALHQEECCCHSSMLPVSKAMTSCQKMLMEKVTMKFSFAPDRLGNRHLLAGKIPYLTPKLYLLVAGCTEDTVGWQRVRPKIKGWSLCPSLDPPCFIPSLSEGPIYRKYHLSVNM